jgi:Protein of unknown function (DUF2400)
MIDSKLKLYLDNKVKLYNNIQFIENDPIVIPHQFSNKQDIEIAGLFAAVFAWGQRVTIINNTVHLTILIFCILSISCINGTNQITA